MRGAGIIGYAFGERFTCPRGSTTALSALLNYGSTAGPPLSRPVRRKPTATRPHQTGTGRVTAAPEPEPGEVIPPFRIPLVQQKEELWRHRISKKQTSSSGGGRRASPKPARPGGSVV